MAELPPNDSVGSREGRRYGAVSVGYPHSVDSRVETVVTRNGLATNPNGVVTVRVCFVRKRKRKLEKERDRYRKKRTAADTG